MSQLAASDQINQKIRRRRALDFALCLSILSAVVYRTRNFYVCRESSKSRTVMHGWRKKRLPPSRSIDAFPAPANKVLNRERNLFATRYKSVATRLTPRLTEFLALCKSCARVLVLHFICGLLRKLITELCNTF